MVVKTDWTSTLRHIKKRCARLCAHKPLDAPDLAEIVDAWPELPEVIKAGILAMIRCVFLTLLPPSGSRPWEGTAPAILAGPLSCPMFGIEPGVIPRRMAVPMGGAEHSCAPSDLTAPS